jgi:hypothetical protein
VRHKLRKENKIMEPWDEFYGGAFFYEQFPEGILREGIRVRDGFDVDLHTLRTHNALAVEREALIAGLVAFVYGNGGRPCEQDHFEPCIGCDAYYGGKCNLTGPISSHGES